MDASTSTAGPCKSLHLLAGMLAKIETSVHSLSSPEGSVVSADSAPSQSVVEANELLRPLEGAKLNVTAAYALASLFYMHQRAQGLKCAAAGEAPHPIHSELRRIKEYVGRVNAAGGGAAAGSAPSSAAGAREAAGRSVFLNKQAARRVIEHELANNGGGTQEAAERAVESPVVGGKKKAPSTLSDTPAAAPRKKSSGGSKRRKLQQAEAAR